MIEELALILSVLLILVGGIGLIAGFLVGKRDINFEVGDKERHKIQVKYKHWQDGVTIFLDGEEVIKIAQTAVLKIGKTELHDVEIQAKGILIPHVKIFVDGQEFNIKNKI